MQSWLSFSRRHWGLSLVTRLEMPIPQVLEQALHSVVWTRQFSWKLFSSGLYAEFSLKTEPGQRRLKRGFRALGRDKVHHQTQRTSLHGASFFGGLYAVTHRLVQSHSPVMEQRGTLQDPIRLLSFSARRLAGQATFGFLSPLPAALLNVRDLGSASGFTHSLAVILAAFKTDTFYPQHKLSPASPTDLANILSSDRGDEQLIHFCSPRFPPVSAGFTIFAFQPDFFSVQHLLQACLWSWTLA